MQSKPSSKQIRQAFLDFFASKGHQVVASSSLVPAGDPTLLFTNAGMNQFKDVFLGFDKRAYTRAASSQKCVRAGGKHNDLENVGYTARHHTFFEMLGNFSFGDYFKQDAIRYAWELLTEVFKLPKDKLTVTVYAEDDEAYDIWHKEIGVPAERIIRIGDNKGARYASDNFWMMGDTGPCGPCTEIFYDHGAHIPGGPPGSPDEDGDRYIEIWNNVFMQFNRDEAGVMHKLPKPSVDTGMGLERIAAVLQGVHANYEIDLFQTLIAAAARETSTSDLNNPSLKVLADHIRACSFLIADGVIPGNEGRGYVLRRIIRRAIRHGYKLGARAAFFHKMVPDLVAEMGEAYPELTQGQQRVTDILRQEEERFFETIENGMAILETELAGMAKSGNATFNGDTAFKLHDTYGFPLDLTADICRERGVTVDTAGFDSAMARQKEQARAAGKFKMATNLDYDGAATTFHGYDTLDATGTVLALYKDGAAVHSLSEGELGVAVLDNTPFYAESGGQVGDRGEIKAADGIFAVEDTQKIQASVFGHHGVLKTGTLKVGDSVQARVDLVARSRTMRNHSATHLMHKALREVLGEHVQQKGSLVDSEKTRFDFVHNAPMTDAQIHEVEQRVNAEILANAATQARVMDIESAQKTGAMMLFGEKYGDEVRVLDIGSSRELCGGTHVARTGDIGLFKLYAESGVAAGVRRVEATTGDTALALIASTEQQLARIADAVKAPKAEAAERVSALLESLRTAEKELERLKSKLAASQGDDLVSQAVEVAGIKLLAAKLDGVDAKGLREVADKLKDKLGSCALLLAVTETDKVSLVAAVSKDLTGKLKAGDLVNFVATQVGGKGGGRPDMAMAGGTDASKLPQALAGVAAWVQQQLA
ncbi:alanine--tRNA ligase [Methylobacillus flagellatus]|uniref:alanine--tRNA ligase n=1 Tax=Methylobacillus flagellatus TaxID=405 RepID=UPI0010F44A50|nr:alanine--tRNA ligase [Methylobacillus flagellatus]